MSSGRAITSLVPMYIVSSQPGRTTLSLIPKASVSGPAPTQGNNDEP